eukprot:bmy_01821T0
MRKISQRGEIPSQVKELVNSQTRILTQVFLTRPIPLTTMTWNCFVIYLSALIGI